jgi:hypothetical protein
MPKTCKHENCKYNVFGGGYCRMHQSYRTDKKPTKIKQTGRIRPISGKQRIKNQDYSKLREVFLKGHPLCEAKLCNCEKIATDVHHKKGRGVYLLAIETWLAICRTCHQWVEEHPDEAKQKGLSDSRLNI